MRKVGTIERVKPPPDPRTKMMNDIIGGGARLKKVDRSSVAEDKAKADKAAGSGGFGGEVLARLEQLRANVAQSDSDSDSDSDWEED